MPSIRFRFALIALVLAAAATSASALTVQDVSAEASSLHSDLLSLASRVDDCPDGACTDGPAIVADLATLDGLLSQLQADRASLGSCGCSQLNSLIGKRAAVDLSAGSLLTDTAVTDRVLPGAGRSLVGIALTAAQLPAEPLQAGDRVRIVDTPSAQGEPPSTTPASIAAEVVSTVGPNDTA